MKHPSKIRKGSKLLQSFLLMINVIIVILLLITGYIYKIPPEKAPLLPFLSYLFPIIAVVNLFIVIYWVLRLRFWFFLSLIGIVLTFQSYRAWCPINLIHTYQADNVLKVMTFNVMNLDFVKNNDKETLSPIITYIIDQQADIVCLQEVGETFVLKGLKDKHVKEALKGYPYIVSGLSEGRYSVVCLSRYPILSSKRINYKSQSNSSYKYVIKVNDDTLTVINNHLESNKLNPKEKDQYAKIIRNGESNEITQIAEVLGSKVGNATVIRASQADAVADEIKKSRNPIVVCGDFNDVPGSYVYRTVRRQLNDAWVNKGNGWGNTFHENLFLFRIDYILHSADIKTLGIKRDKVQLSDHYPLIATIKL